MIIHLGRPLLTGSSGSPGGQASKCTLPPYLTLLRVEIARFIPD
jgi:hypothetical protein